VHASSRTGARRVHPVTGGVARSGRRDEVRRPASQPTSEQAWVEAQHRDRQFIAWRRQAQGHGLAQDLHGVGGSNPAARLASGQVLGTYWSVRATTMLAHAQPRHARSARPSGNQRRILKRHGDARVPCKKDHDTTAVTHEVHRMTTVSPRARRPAHRKV
jgi:hypothetical protein